MNICKHSLILLWGSDTATKREWAAQNFSEHLIITQADVRQEITGHVNSPMNRFIVKEEIKHRVHLRLSMGQQVILILDDHTHVDVHGWATLCDSLCAHMCVVCFNQKLTTSRVQVIPYDQVCVTPQPIQRVLAVGDVHGDHVSMHKAWRYAQDNQLHVVWLGDVVDYGDQNLKCVHLAYESVRNHQATMIWGNHERKITRWMDSDWGAYYKGRLSDANWKTIQEIEMLNDARRMRLRAAWKCLESASYQILQLAAWTFTHGAVHDHVWGQTAHRLTGQAGEWAYFGQVLSDEPNAQGYPQRSWTWIHELPAQARVVVGHDWIDRERNQFVHKVADQGAQVWCMDTGSSKGGQLSALEIDLLTNKWESRVFKP